MQRYPLLTKRSSTPENKKWMQKIVTPLNCRAWIETNKRIPANMIEPIERYGQLKGNR